MYVLDHDRKYVMLWWTYEKWIMENKIDTANAKFDNWITQRLNIALCRIYYCEKYTIIIIIINIHQKEDVQIKIYLRVVLTWQFLAQVAIIGYICIHSF